MSNMYLLLQDDIGASPACASKVRGAKTAFAGCASFGDSLCASCVTGSLIKLDLTQMGLSCEFPYTEMQAFQALTSISFQGNAVTGDVKTIGASLKGLSSQLTYFDLSFKSYQRKLRRYLFLSIGTSTSSMFIFA